MERVVFEQEGEKKMMNDKRRENKRAVNKYSSNVRMYTRKD